MPGRSVIAPLKVLLVEDDRVDRMAFERHVKDAELDWAWSSAASLAEARGKLERGEFDVVLSDYHLGDGTGLDVLELAADLPVVVVTGAGDEETAVRAMHAGAYDYLVKDTGRRYLRMVPTVLENACRHHASERRARVLQQALTSINDAIYVVDMSGRFRFVNQTFCAIYGWREEEILGRSHEILWTTGRSRQELLPVDPEALPADGERGECRHRRRDGSELPVLLSRSPIVDERGQRVAAVGAVRDITERKRVEAKLAYAALHDDLTGLPNRALFMDRLDRAVKRLSRSADRHFGVIFLDLDRFKVINDSLGHLVGDRLLQAIAQRLESCLRTGDTVARLGGDEFAILLEELEDVSEVDRVAERIHRELDTPFPIDGRELFTAASLGIALSTTGYQRPEDLLRDADTAMYRAKAQGRRRVTFDPEMHTRVVDQLQLENDLHRALERDELEVYFQPLVRLGSGRVVGLEALVRWQHPERGLLLPGEFLPAAREAGLMATIGWRVMTEECGRMKRWQDRFPTLREAAVSVNLDGDQLASGELLERVEQVLEQTGLAPRSLELEITEGMLLDRPEVVATVLDRLNRQGIRLHVDDFGTGYSSLSQLERFPFDCLKIDRSFILRLRKNSGDPEIVRAIIALARHLKLEVMAEGVETVEQLARLEALGCSYGQGFLFAKPLSPAVLEGLLEANPAPFARFSSVGGRRLGTVLGRDGDADGPDAEAAAEASGSASGSATGATATGTTGEKS